ncbi:molybdenum cofactor synthesis domain protein [Ammonifex degensii KC4]|uniref:Molybdopterin molybdenumtransferase n=1 Tax=Ammonifex degensii (strain DSM 10501 / KC4) TaxID=429009 RepID=C9RCS9_AMMDK|nr:molybdopterin biosynthesis protein [Ammonifex degensii]ACX52056.1 molybdenum cofactor synthesis domain protein [Ammonifex degensii KC4]
MQRNVYLEEKPLPEAQEGYLNFLREKGALKLKRPPEKISAQTACGRVTAAPVFARLSHPHFHQAAMDGYAVKAALTFGASELSPRRLTLGVEAFPVDTGDVLPEGTDAVIMVEDVHQPEPDKIEIIKPIFPYQNVRVVGEDIVATEMIVPANHLLRPVDIGALLAGGVDEVLVYPRPRVVIIPTGDELVPSGTPDPAPGRIIDFNSPMLAELVREWGGEPIRYPIVPDDMARLEEAVRRGLEEGDVVVLNAGSSAGREDFTAPVLRRLGEVFAHGVAIKPGKPVVLGEAAGKPVLGIPGYPVSAVLAAELFLRPVLAALTGQEVPARDKVQAVLSRRIVSPAGVEEFVRVKLGRIGERIVATPLGRGAGMLLTLVRADGILRVPRFSEGFEAGSQVEVELLRRLEEIENTVVVIGSHDLALDIIANFLRLLFPRASLSSAHVGSLGGLMALKRGEAHLAGTHLLDEETGEYNVPYIKRYLAGVPVVLVNLAYREQGFIVAPGNPKGIKDFKDLVREDVRLVNRQKGAGTRVLLDYHLRQRGIDPRRIQGYEREEYTHMAVAAAVASGVADVGLGIRAAALALGCDFVPVAEERYDLCFLRPYWEGKVGEWLRAVLDNPEFRRAVEARGGYDLRDCGRVLYIQEG